MKAHSWLTARVITLFQLTGIWKALLTDLGGDFSSQIRQKMMGRGYSYQIRLAHISEGLLLLFFLPPGMAAMWPSPFW